MIFKSKPKNRRFERDNVLDVKMHSRHLRSIRLKRGAKGLTWLLGAATMMTLGWVGSEWLLRRFLFENPTFAIRNIDVRTDGSIARGHLSRWTGLDHGDNLFAVDLERVERDLKLNSFIQDVAVDRVLPGTLWLRVSEREPVAQFMIWKETASTEGLHPVTFYLDESGTCIVPSDFPAPEEERRQRFGDMPSFKGVNIKEASIGKPIASPPVRAALELVRIFGESSLDGVDELREIDVSDARVLKVTTRRNSLVTLGFDRLPEQLHRWRVVHDYAVNSGFAIRTLDLSVSNNVPARWQDLSAVPATPPKSHKRQPLRKKNV